MKSQCANHTKRFKIKIPLRLCWCLVKVGFKMYCILWITTSILPHSSVGTVSYVRTVSCVPLLSLFDFMEEYGPDLRFGGRGGVFPYCPIDGGTCPLEHWVLNVRLVYFGHDWPGCFSWYDSSPVLSPLVLLVAAHAELCKERLHMFMTVSLFANPPHYPKCCSHYGRLSSL